MTFKDMMLARISNLEIKSQTFDDTISDINDKLILQGAAIGQNHIDITAALASLSALKIIVDDLTKLIETIATEMDGVESELNNVENQMFDITDKIDYIENNAHE